ncbi:hypothetical protein BRC97_01040 [Halobacteriales archaeon QS_6_71_20]|nr:MAG: hypothetical protein BRC97_01040 [Halobacteriales archaeon QS_6_71_20]
MLAHREDPSLVAYERRSEVRPLWVRPPSTVGARTPATDLAHPAVATLAPIVAPASARYRRLVVGASENWSEGIVSRRTPS